MQKSKEFKKFEQRFGEEVIDMLILTKETVIGACVVGDMLQPSLEFTASVDLRTGELSTQKGRLEWMIKNERSRDVLWGYDFKQFQIYHIKARKNIPVQPAPHMMEVMNNCYMLIEVVEENVSEPRLNELKAHLETPVTIEDELLGKFELDRQFSWFSGNIDWLGDECSVSLETDEEDGETANKAFEVLKQLYGSLREWDNKLRTFAAAQLTDLANDWLDEDIDEDSGEEPAEITEKDFADRIFIGELTISPDGDLTLYYNDDDMFYGHVILIDANINGEISDANIAG